MEGGDISIEALMGTLADTTAFNDLKKRMERLSKGPKALDTPAARALEQRAVRKVPAPPSITLLRCTAQPCTCTCTPSPPFPFLTPNACTCLWKLCRG